MKEEVNDIYNKGRKILLEHNEKGKTVNNTIRQLKEQLEEANKILQKHSATPINERVGNELGAKLFGLDGAPEDINALADWVSFSLKIPKSFFGELPRESPNDEEEEEGAGGSGVPRKEETD